MMQFGSSQFLVSSRCTESYFVESRIAEFHFTKSHFANWNSAILDSLRRVRVKVRVRVRKWYSMIWNSVKWTQIS